jgi:hypothetical protein
MRQLVEGLPVVLRPRLIRIAELLVPAVTAGSESALHACRFCDMRLCRSDVTLPCPVALAASSRDSPSRWVDPELPAIYSDRTVIQGCDPAFELWLEPGGIAFRLDATRRLEVFCRSPVRGRMESEKHPKGHITLYAWDHATFNVLEAGRETSSSTGTSSSDAPSSQNDGDDTRGLSLAVVRPEDRLEVDDRSAVDRFERSDPEPPLLDGADPYPVQPHRVGTVR